MSDSSNVFVEISVLECIKAVNAVMLSQDSDSTRFTDEACICAEALIKYLHVEWKEMLFFVGVFMSHYSYSESMHQNGSVDRICEEMNIEEECLFQNLNLLDKLVEMDYIYHQDDNPMSIAPEKAVYHVNACVVNCIFRNLPLSTANKNKITDAYQFVKTVMQYFTDSLLDENISHLFVSKLERLERLYAELPFVKEVKREILSVHNRAVFYVVCACALKEKKQDLHVLLNIIYEDTSARLKHWDSLRTQTNALIQLDIVAYDETKHTLSLEDEGKKLFFNEYKSLFAENREPEKKEYNIVEAASILQKELFYNVPEKRQISDLYKIVENSCWLRLQEKLEHNKLNKSICMLFYGEPGTGKTETCLQLARQSGRKVMRVDIASTRTKWYGESENLLKKVFDNYKQLCEKEKLTPILLFNEADAFFMNRKDHKDDDTTHRMQNILLEEMERLEGILVATTNLPDTLDVAFERRFLFKVKFEAPDEDVRRQIWKSRLPGLNDSDYTILAKKYVLSGAEIENVLRKLFIREVINDSNASLLEVCSLCETEKLAKDRIRVGFSKAS